MSDPTKPDATSDQSQDTTQETFPDGLGDQGKVALKAERDARKAAEKAAKDAASELDTLRKEKAEAAAAKAAADEADAAKRGEFEALATKRKQEADEAKADAAAKAKTLERANTVLASVITARVAELTATEDKELIAAFPKDAEPLDQLEWLDDPRTRAALKVATETKKVTDANGKPKVPSTPRPDANANGKQTDEDARAAMARNYRDW